MLHFSHSLHRLLVLSFLISLVASFFLRHQFENKRRQEAQMSMQKHRRLFKVHAPARAASAFALSKAEVLDN